MNNLEETRCHAIIHAAAASAATAAALSAQIPCADNLVLSGIEIVMICSLGDVFGIQIDESIASGLVATQAGTLGGRCVSQLLVGWIPGYGNITNAVTAASFVETLGWIFADKFDNEAKGIKAAKAVNA